MDRFCEGCARNVGSRYRTWANVYLCNGCYAEFLDTGIVPVPTVEDVVTPAATPATPGAPPKLPAVIEY